ncbi:MAG: hypothetical protein ACKO2P_21005 [Planctomycetota bacterium]
MIRSQGRRLQSRRSAAVMIWVSMVLLALLLWRSRVDGQIQSLVWEPAVLVLSAFVTFLSLFGWLLFWPDRSTTEESPLLFLAGLLTLIPPCVIAWLMMPPGAVLRPWLSMALLIFGILTMLSPIPAELFRVPRERRHWLQLVTDASLSLLDVEPPRVSFDNVQPQTHFRLTRPLDQPQSDPLSSARSLGREQERERDTEEPTRDPWEDPFRGTGRRLSRVRDAAAAATGGGAAAATVSRTATTTAGPAAVTGPAVPQTPPPVPVPRLLQQQFPNPPVAGSSVVPDVRALDRSIRDEERCESMEAETGMGAASGGLAEEDASEAGLTSEILSMERTTDEFGGVMVEGVARAVFKSGQKRVNLQIPLSPPLPGVPEAECEPAGHEPLRARVALRQPYGLRIEVRRSEASSPLEADIAFSAVFTPSRPG